jgi:predicted nucleotidyltransferase
MDDDAFVRHVAGRLSGLPGVQAVSLGGSRAQGTHRADSDWDFAIYYRGRFRPQDLRDVGWPGEVSELGGWGGGVFNGGAWLQIDGRPADVHYRDLDSIDHELAETRAGRFRTEPLMYHLAGIPTYLVLAELALSKTLYGDLPRPAYPQALRAAAPAIWGDRAERTLGYARAYHAPAGRLTPCAGLIAQAAMQAAHAVLAARGAWVTNDKTLLTRSGLSPVDQIIAQATPDADALLAVTDQARALCAGLIDAAVADRDAELRTSAGAPGAPAVPGASMAPGAAGEPG